MRKDNELMESLVEYPIDKPFGYYLTDLEGSNCEILEDWDINLMPFKWRGVDLDQFKADCEEIDRD